MAGHDPPVPEGRRFSHVTVLSWRYRQADAIRSTLAKSQRDIRLDLFRGLANWLIFLGHIPATTVLAWFTTRNYGFSDGADLFVFISGYTVTLVFGKMMLDHGFVVGATRLLRRVWQLYVAQVLLFVFYLTAVHYFSHRFNEPHLMDQFNVSYLMDSPVETLTYGLILRFKPLNLDVLPLYIVLMVGFPVVLWLMLRWRDFVMLASIVVYLLARGYGWNLAAYPTGTWYFNPFAWQLLFVFGAWLALGGAKPMRGALRSPILFVLSGGFLLLSFLTTLAERIPGLQEFFPALLIEAFVPNDKTNLAPYRVVHLICLVYIVVSVMPSDWRGLRWSLFKPLIRCGQQSLAVFCVGVFLAFVAHFVLVIVSGGVLMELAAGAAGISTMTAIAYYRTWSKQVDREIASPTRRSGQQ